MTEEKRNDDAVKTPDRTPRELETRAQDQRESDAWVPPTNLPSPNPREGIEHRWIRTSSLGNADNTNVSKRFREGWKPVLAKDYPELEVMSDIDSRFPENVEIGGLLLCAAPSELVRQMQAHNARVAAGQMEAVDHNYLKDNDPRMPMLAPDRKTRTSFGRG